MFNKRSGFAAVRHLFNFVMTVAVSLHYLLNALWECGAPK
jgi:hypothetical protein